MPEASAPTPAPASPPESLLSQPRLLVIITAMLSAIWPSVTAVSGLLDHWRTERREERKLADDLRNTYLNRMGKLYEAASTDNQRLQHTKAQYILRDNQSVLFYVTQVSEDAKLRTWADSEKRRVQELIDAETVWLENDTQRQARMSIDELHAKQADLHVVEDALKQKTSSTLSPAGNANANGGLLRKQEELQGQVRSLQEKFNTVVAERVPLTVAAPAARSPGAADAPPPVAHSARRILWVDDHPAGNAELVRILRANGAEVVTAVSTAEAEEVLRGHRFDLILSDVVRDSKEDDGRVLLRALRQRKDETPFLFYALGGAQLVRAEQVATEGAQGITDVPSELFAKISYFLPGFKIDVSKAL